MGTQGAKEGRYRPSTAPIDSAPNRAEAAATYKKGDAFGSLPAITSLHHFFNNKKYKKKTKKIQILNKYEYNNY